MSDRPLQHSSTDPHPAAPSSPALPTLRTALDAAAILARLDAAARRGRLPGLVAPAHRALFEVREFGEPFESTLVATLVDGEIRFALRLRPTMPLVFVLIVALTIWPGVWLTESFLAVLGGSFWRWTWWWYLPLSVVGGAWALRSAWARSRATAALEAPRIIERIAGELASP
jgi:hypothetical protein